jgi:hypothetical protein
MKQCTDWTCSMIFGALLDAESNDITAAPHLAAIA